MTFMGRAITLLRRPIFLSFILLCIAKEVTATPISIDTVPVGNLGNSADTTGFGAVNDYYRIGTTEVTNAQYAAFLNAKAASDPLGLYNTSMENVFLLGGISRSGSSGSYSYSPISGRENLPVNYVNWYDAIRFVNWLHNGQGNGDTETGAYTVLGGSVIPSNGLSIARNPGAQWFLPSHDEWYKAAYHKNDGDTANYFDYPTSSDTAPTAQLPPAAGNSANYDTPSGDLNEVGAYLDSSSPYGTFDQAGNLIEWTESTSGTFRIVRGGSYNSSSNLLLATLGPGGGSPSNGVRTVGFRVATVPEPSSFLLATLAFAGGLLITSLRAQSNTSR